MAKQTPLTCSGHTRPVVDLSFSEITEDGYFLISACKDGKPMLRQGDTGDWIGTFLGHKGAVWAATLNKNATKAATGAADFSANLWDAVTGETVATFPHKHIVKAVAFSPDCTRLLTGGQEKLVRSFYVEKPAADPDVIGTHEGAIKKAIWTEDGKTTITAADDKTIRKWEVNTKQEVQRITLSSLPSDVQLSSDGTVLVVSHSKQVSVYDAAKFEKLFELNLPTNVYSASLHPQKKYIVAGGEDLKLYKFDYESLEELDSYKGHFGPVHIVRFSPDGELYASGSEDGTVRLWQCHIGTNYGLWRCVQQGEEDEGATTT
uniref:Serine-threonine kinase receptor-associated protein n=1 Tax=Phallusia mammillata TaxID=59560 RepID=A0A6F9DUH7_9ASCI|nr:serine-threonine kinase receptor-associated protein [Phallusia mammillata]